MKVKVQSAIIPIHLVLTTAYYLYITQEKTVARQTDFTFKEHSPSCKYITYLDGIHDSLFHQPLGCVQTYDVIPVDVRIV